MARLIKRDENRKLYDTEAKQYVSLAEIAALVRAGQEIVVTDNATGADLTAQTLTKVILETEALPPQFLHELVRSGGRLVSAGYEQFQRGLDRLIQASLERLTPVREAREDMEQVRQRVAELEEQIRQLEAQHGDDTDRSTE